MKKISIKKFIACFSIFALVFTMIFPPLVINAKGDQCIRKDFPKQIEIYNENECKFQELNKKIHSEDLRLFLNKIKKARRAIIPALSAILYFSTAMLLNKDKLDIETTSKHFAIATGVGVTAGILDRLASYIMDEYV